VNAVILYHGTASGRAGAVAANGFRAPFFLSPHFDDAAQYAMMGGEQDLQDREEAFHAEHGEWPRDLYDTCEMWQILYPEGEFPVVLEVRLPAALLAEGVPDPHGGPAGNLRFARAVSGEFVVGAQTVEWPDDGPDGAPPTP
jgi:hypothetical protein